MSNTTELLASMYDNEDYQVSSIFDQEILTKFQNVYDDCDEVQDDDLDFTAEMVLVRAARVNGRVYNVVEMADLTKYMESSGLDAYYALDRIGTANGVLDNKTFGILIDPMDEAMELVSEAKKTKDQKSKKKKIEVIDKAGEAIKDLKDKGIKVFKKKSKKKKKK